MKLHNPVGYFEKIIVEFSKYELINSPQEIMLFENKEQILYFTEFFGLTGAVMLGHSQNKRYHYLDEQTDIISFEKPIGIIVAAHYEDQYYLETNISKITYVNQPRKQPRFHKGEPLTTAVRRLARLVGDTRHKPY